MALRISAPGEASRPPRERIILYGRAGVGKTRLALSLTPRFGKEILYYAADTNTQWLDSIALPKRDRVRVVEPEGDDPIQNFMEFCARDWSKVYPNVGTIVVDTFTKVALDCIRYSANSGAVDREKHYRIGDPANGGQTLPNRGDYQASESISRGFMDMMFTRQKDLHIIFVCHEDVKMVENIPVAAGPAHPGRAMLEYIPAQFSTVIRLIRDTQYVPGVDDVPRSVVVAIGENDGLFIAKVRTSNETGPNPLARVVLERDPINYWQTYDQVFAPQEVSA